MTAPGTTITTLEARGEAAWARLTAAARKEAASLIDQLEAALAPATKAATRAGSHPGKRNWKLDPM